MLSHHCAIDCNAQVKDTVYVTVVLGCHQSLIFSVDWYYFPEDYQQSKLPKYTNLFTVLRVAHYGDYMYTMVLVYHVLVLWYDINLTLTKTDH